MGRPRNGIEPVNTVGMAQRFLHVLRARRDNPQRGITGDGLAQIQIQALLTRGQMLGRSRFERLQLSLAVCRTAIVPWSAAGPSSTPSSDWAPPCPISTTGIWLYPGRRRRAGTLADLSSPTQFPAASMLLRSDCSPLASIFRAISGLAVARCR